MDTAAAVPNKLLLLEQRKKMWSNGKMLSKAREDIGYTGPSSGSSSGQDADVILNRLTSRITANLREELQIEMAKQHQLDRKDCKDLAGKMEEYLSAELHTHICQICFELMVSPERTPILLFPCGHTFCRVCAAAHKAKATGRSAGCCPYCREKIQSRAENQSLKQLIERYVSQKKKLEKGDVRSLDDVFGGLARSHRNGQSILNTEFGGEQGRERNSGGAMVRKYTAEYESCKMRHGILKNELEDSRQEQQLISQRVKAAEQAERHLLGEKAAVHSQIESLMDELALVEAHLNEQKNRRMEAEMAEKRMDEQITVIAQAVKSLEVDMEKAKLIADDLQTSAGGS